MSKTSDSSQPDAFCANLDFPRTPPPQVRLVVHFADDWQLRLCDRCGTDLVVKSIAAVKLIQQRQRKGAIQ